MAVELKRLPVRAGPADNPLPVGLWHPRNVLRRYAIVGAAGNPPLTQLVVRSGDVLDAIQAMNTGSFQSTPVQYILLQHGGDGGSANTVTIPSGDVVVQASGFTGMWFGWNCVLQITLKTKSGKVFGPFGTMNNASSKTPFQYNAPTGQSIVAFSGAIVQVPLGGGGQTYIIASRYDHKD